MTAADFASWTVYRWLLQWQTSVVVTFEAANFSPVEPANQRAMQFKSEAQLATVLGRPPASVARI